MYYNNHNCENNSIYSSRIKNENDKVVLEVPVPGFAKEDLNLKIDENFLVLAGKKEDFSIDRQYKLGDKIDRESIDAEVVNGVLVVTLKKNSPETKEIAIN